MLLTTDAAISTSDKPAGQVIQEIFSNWNSGVLLGLPRNSALQVASLLKAVMPGIIWNNLVYGIACLAASIIFILGFRKKLNAWAVLCGAVTAFWLGSNFTLLYAGHTFKPYVVLFFICTVFSAGATSWRGGILWGGLTGLMFVQQPDIALFFALFAGAYLLFRLWQKQGLKPLKWLKVLIPAAGMAFLFAAGPLLSGYTQYVKGAAQMHTETSQEKWNYITQWSFPPEETIAFIAPGYTGWRSGEPEGPYWGRMGRSPGWEQTHQGFMNFKLENTYLGFIPVACALFALFSCRRSPHRSEILFWSVAAGVALLLAFGKYFPLYSIFYRLPVVNNIRNPNKFLQVFQICLAILTAYGVDALLCSDEPKTVRRFFWCVAGACGLLMLGALSATLDRTGGVSGFLAQGGSQDAAQVIVKNKTGALWHASVMAALTAAAFAVFSFPGFGKILRFKNWIAAALVLLVAADAVALSKHYVKEMPRSYIEANALTDFLKKDLGTQRVALLTRQGIYNIWLTYLLPYNHISVFNFSDMPRMASDYKTFLEAGQRDPLNMWRFSAVKYLLAPVTVEKQLSAVNCRKVFAYTLFQGPDGGYGIAPDTNGPFAVFELSDTMPRYALFAGSRKGSDELALNRLSDFSTVILSPEATLPELPGSGQTGAVDVLAYRPGKVTLRTRSGVPAILRCAEKYDADWKASVDGEAVDVGRVDYLCQGVFIPAGEHTVELRYAPSRIFLYMQGGGYLILFGALVVVMIQRKETHGAD